MNRVYYVHTADRKHPAGNNTTEDDKEVNYTEIILSCCNQRMCEGKYTKLPEL